MDALNIIYAILDDPVRLAPAIAAISAMATVTALSWPFLDAQRRRNRMKRAAGAERHLRDTAAKARHDRTDDVIRLRHAAPKRLYSTIVEQLNLGELIKNPRTQTLIHQAGYRGPAAAIKFTAMRVLVAVALGAAAAFYTSFVVLVDQPLAVRALVVVGLAYAGWQGPIIFLKNRLQKRRTEIQRNWPDAMDLMLICVESGMSIEAAFAKVAEEISVQSLTLSEELSLTTAELAYLQDRQKAYRRLAARTDVEDVRSVVTSLIQSEKYGTPVGQALRVLSKESRALRMAAAEKKAAALPPKLTVPMIVFFLPVLFAVIMTPAIIQMMRG
jgi:tight adherence protein C